MQQPDAISPSYGCMSPDSSSENVDAKSIGVKLLDEEHLWTQFNKLGTEMIVTKPGRQMFPTVKVWLQNLSPLAYYKLYMEVIPVGGTRYKFEKGKWQPKENYVTNFLQSSWLQHPDSPSPGYKWMLKPVNFNAKLTNCLERMDKETIWLRSMHKYMIVIHVEEGTNVTSRNPLQSRAFPFPETVFYAVTSYQNPLVKELKTEKNIHAKGARYKKRKSSEYSDENSNENVSDNEKRSRLDSDSLSNPLSSGSRTTPNYPLTFSSSRWNETSIPSTPADLMKWENPYIPPVFRYHFIPTPVNRGRIPFVSPLSIPLCSPSCLDCKRSQNFSMYPQGFPFGHIPSPNFINVYPNRVVPPNFDCSAVYNGLPTLRVCPACLNNRGACDRSVVVNTSDRVSPTSTADVVGVPSLLDEKSPTPTVDSTATLEDSSVDKSQSSSDTSSDNLSSTIDEFLSSVVEAIKSS